MVFHKSLSDSKSPQVSRTRPRILAVFSNGVVWIVSTRPPTSKSSRPFNNPLVIVPKALITIGTIVTFMFHSCFNSLARSRYLSFFSLSFRIILCSDGVAKSTILQIFFFFFLWIIMRSGLLAGIKWCVCMLKSHESLCSLLLLSLLLLLLLLLFLLNHSIKTSEKYFEFLFFNFLSAFALLFYFNSLELNFKKRNFT